MDEIILVVLQPDLIKYKRLDLYLTHQLEELSRSAIKDLFKKGNICAGEVDLELKKMPPVGTRIVVSIPEKIPSKALAENIPLEIIYQDEHLAVVNKAAGMVTHPAPGNYQGTLVNAILYHCPDIQGVGDTKRPGIVHRLDKGTSGVMVIAKTDRCHQGLVELFASHDIERRYEAIVLGTKLERMGIIKTMIGRHRYNRLKMTSRLSVGKDAITHFRVIQYYSHFSHVELKLETGRTHQIRVHMSEVKNAPIICDPLYGNPSNHLKRIGSEAEALLKDYPYPLLHAKVLGFVHPITKEPLRFEVAPPPIFSKLLNQAKLELA